jgi:hypothetical protein
MSGWPYRITYVAAGDPWVEGKNCVFVPGRLRGVAEELLARRGREALAEWATALKRTDSLPLATTRYREGLWNLEEAAAAAHMSAGLFALFAAGESRP